MLLLCSCGILIQGLQVNIAHKTNSMQLQSWVEYGMKGLFSDSKKQQSLQVQMHAIFVALILRFQLVLLTERNTFWPKIYLDPWKDWSWLNLLSRSFENSSWCKVDPQDGKSSHEQEIASFFLHLTILQDEKQTDNQNPNILQKIILRLMSFWPKIRSDECHFLSLELPTFCYALMTSIAP